MSNPLCKKLIAMIEEEKKGVEDYSKLLEEMEESGDFTEDNLDCIDYIIEDEERHTKELESIVKSMEKS